MKSKSSNRYLATALCVILSLNFSTSIWHWLSSLARAEDKGIVLELFKKCNDIRAMASWMCKVALHKIQEEEEYFDCDFISLFRINTGTM